MADTLISRQTVHALFILPRAPCKAQTGEWRENCCFVPRSYRLLQYRALGRRVFLKKKACSYGVREKSETFDLIFLDNAARLLRCSNFSKWVEFFLLKSCEIKPSGATNGQSWENI